MSELMAGYIPDTPWVRVGRIVYYPISGHEAWLESQLQQLPARQSRMRSEIRP